MNNKIVKKFGIVLAIFLILIIVSFSMFVISFVFSFATEPKNNSNIMEKIEYNDDIKSLDINILASKLIITKGEINSLETNNSNIKSEIDNGILKIKEKKHYFYKNKNFEVILTLKDNVYDSINFETGAGNIYIDTLKTNSLKFDFGAGASVVQNLEVYENAEINGGVGTIQILDGELNNLNLSAGVGKFTLISKIKGKSSIDSGIGELTVNLKGLKDDYKVSLDKGIGTIYIDGVATTEKDIGTGENTLDIDGGIGKINLNFNYQEIDINRNEISKIKVLEYFKNNNSEWIIVGKLEQGYFEDNQEINLMQDLEKISSTTLIDETNRYSEKSVKDCKIGEKVFIKINNISEEQLKLINYIEK